MQSGKSIKRNYIYNLLYEIVLIITPFITTPYVSRVLGADGVGIYSFNYSNVTYFILVAGLGTTRYGQREISYFQEDIEARSIAFWNTEIIRIITTSLMLFCYFTYAFFQKENRIICFILAINLLNVPLDISWFFQGIEEFGKLVRRNIIFRILTVASIFIFVRNAEDVPAYVLCLSGLTAFGSLSLWPFLKGNIRKIEWKKLKLSSTIKTTLTFFVPTIAIQIYTFLDKTMIGVITGNSFQNGYYEQAQKIVAIALTFITSIGTIMIPRMGFFYAQGKSEEIKKYLEKSFRFVWMMSIPMCLGIFVIANNFVPWFFGNGYDDVIPLLKVFSLIMIALGINNVVGLQFLIPTGRQNTYTLCVIMGAIINLVCNIILIPRLGAFGAAIASVFAEFCIALVELWIIHKEINISTVVKSSAKYIVSGLLMFGCTFFVSRMLSSSIINSIVIVTIGIIVYSVTLFILQDSFFVGNINKALRRIRRIR